ncbi:uracil-DNA glycosylase [Glaciimonas soli]|uniref:Type-4 uracil-DNA glycosylase n=1 Tax=Glaciimonas soli TaxID=2590999 RepID=A0A843YNR9_9BURK|nr:uracil-DNA glycosylase [Glaciimonas soli]MQR01489.1 uracil-DNA glycosylase [Glaciimonas soli]
MNANRRAAILEECGVGPVWLLRGAGSEELQTTSVEIISNAPLDLIATTSAITPEKTAPEKIAPAKIVPEQIIPEAVSEFAGGLVAEGKPRIVHAPAASAWDVTPLSSSPDSTQIAKMDSAQLQMSVAACKNCGLCHGRRHTVFGVGDQKARWLFIGEGPGRNEDQQGEPFVGPAGKLLDNMLAAMGVGRGKGGSIGDAYIANIVKCRPTDESGRDRPPSAEEVAACLPYLQRQIALIQPTVLVALGKTAALSLLGFEPTTAVAALRGKVHRYAELPLIVTYHPAYLLRQPADKAKVWDDLCLAMRTMQTNTRDAA